MNPADVFISNDNILKFERRGPGWGHGGYHSDARWDSSIILLNGIRKEYTEEEFTIKDIWGNTKLAKGIIKIDRDNKTLEVNISVNGQPYEFNGRYSFSKSLAKSTETTYYPNGQKKAVIEYEDGIEINRTEWDKNGNLIQ